VENYDSGGSNSEHNEGEEPKKEPDSARTCVVAGLSDAEGTEEGGRERLKESHTLMVRCCAGVTLSREGLEEESTKARRTSKRELVAACCNGNAGLD
jgi:hypothetical protein